LFITGRTKPSVEPTWLHSLVTKAGTYAQGAYVSVGSKAPAIVLEMAGSGPFAWLPGVAWRRCAMTAHSFSGLSATCILLLVLCAQSGALCSCGRISARQTMEFGAYRSPPARRAECCLSHVQSETDRRLLGFFTENRCGGAPCAPAAACKPARKRTKVPA
jgi:hypothetical protein